MLGLPGGTPNDLLECEADAERVKVVALRRAVSYEGSIQGKSSAVLRAASEAIWKNRRTMWGRAREKKMDRLGWGLVEARRTFAEPTGPVIIQERINDIEQQERAKKRKSQKGYFAAKTNLPEYLERRNPNAKIIARFRCGVENRAKQGWRIDRLCRLCGQKEEDMEHLASHDPQQRSLEVLLGEDGAGIDWMKAVIHTL